MGKFTSRRARYRYYDVLLLLEKSGMDDVEEEYSFQVSTGTEGIGKGRKVRAVGRALCKIR